MRVATWNINNVNKRLHLLLDWLKRTQPDVVALQELKATTSDFPLDALRNAGYEAVVVGQKSWNGVALLSKGHEPLPVVSSLPGDAKDKQARYVEAAINGVLFACLYLPNGNPWPGPKFDYKLAWFKRMRQRAAELWDTGQPVVLLGDWNVVPTDMDVYKPDSWRDNALLQPQAREAFSAILEQGWTDAIGALHPASPLYTFWDYRRQRWERDAGLRIDHILVSDAVSVKAVGVDRDERGLEGASDHAPVWAEISVKKRRASTARNAATSKTAGKSKKADALKLPGSVDFEAPLARYNAKRDFSKTAEPAGVVRHQAKNSDALQFVVQKHWASRLHYDLRLELDGVMLSWAVPKGPSFDPAVKQMAIHVEDHPLTYNTFEGTIPKGEYGAGTVIVWDRGTWTPVGDPREGMAKGKLVFQLHGEKLAGLWELVHIGKPGEKSAEQWLLLKKRGDGWARPTSEYNVITALPDSVIAKPLGHVEEREPRQSPVRRKTASEVVDDLRHAKPAPLPDKIAPQLATLVSSVPAGEWVKEHKLDGYRMLARLDGPQVRLFTRNGNDWTSKLRPIATALADLDVQNGWLDGEIVVLNDQGFPDFNQLQNAIDNSRTAIITMFVFDVPFLNGRDMRDVPLLSRRAELKRIFERYSGDTLRFSESFDAPSDQLLSAACQLGLEGVMLKRADSRYVSGRTETWLKLKCQLRQEFVVVGFTNRANAPAEVGGLMLAYHEHGELRYAGSVGTGWSSATGRDLHKQLSTLETGVPAVDAATVKPGRWSKRTAGAERWVRPSMVVEVAFSEWTPDGHVRHPTFRGVRTDKPSGRIVRERPKETAERTAATPPRRAPTIRVTNPERVIDPSTGFRKVDLIQFYESIAEWMLPHLVGRPVSLVRAPQGIGGQLFFHKHPDTKMPLVKELDASLWPGHASLMSVDSPDALVSAAQMNAVEFHTWNSKAKDIDRPDRFVLDLDPGEGVSWSMLQEAAVLTRAMLTELGLESWLKTSGGKGLHVVVPLTPRIAYDEVKAFSQAVVKHMARVIPSRFVAVAGGGNRVGKIFIDYLRNGHGQTTAAAFSARARPGMGVSMPVGWEQLQELKSGAQWTIATAREYLSFQQQDPWASYWKKRQSLSRAIKMVAA